MREAQERTLREVAADVAILTEPPSSYQRGRAVVTSPPERAGRNGPEAWVAIVGECVEPVDLVVPFARMAVAARAVLGTQAAIIYGSVLPWLSIRSHAPELVIEGEASFDAFERVLAKQARDIEELRQIYGQRVVWAGDFNETVEGAVGGSW